MAVTLTLSYPKSRQGGTKAFVKKALKQKSSGFNLVLPFYRNTCTKLCLNSTKLPIVTVDKIGQP